MSELVEKVAEDASASVSDTEEVINNDASPIDNGPLKEPLASELVDVVTFNEDRSGSPVRQL